MMILMLKIKMVSDAAGLLLVTLWLVAGLLHFAAAAAAAAHCYLLPLVCSFVLLVLVLMLSLVDLSGVALDVGGCGSGQLEVIWLIWSSSSSLMSSRSIARRFLLIWCVAAIYLSPMLLWLSLLLLSLQMLLKCLLKGLEAWLSP